MHLYFLLLGMLVVVTTTPSPYDLDLFTSDLGFNPILSDNLQPDIPLDDYTFALPDPSVETYTDINMGNQIPFDETYFDIDTGNNIIPTGVAEASDDTFNVESNPPDMSLALLDPELQPLLHAPDCPKGKSILCCDPTKEFFPAAVELCIWCMNAANFRHPSPPPHNSSSMYSSSLSCLI